MSTREEWTRYRREARKAQTLDDLVRLAEKRNPLAASDLAARCRTVSMDYFTVYSRYIEPKTNLTLGDWDQLLNEADLLHHARERYGYDW